MQRKLELAGFGLRGVDGIFGPKTFAAVLSFQKTHGLVPDGDVGPHTAEALSL